MRTVLFAALCGVFLTTAPSTGDAQDRVRLGVGRMFTNDLIGDGDDRWRTGSYVVSGIRGPEWTGRLPTSFGEILEYRRRGEVIAPENLSNGAFPDRRYVGALSFGVHTHYRYNSTEIAMGADLVAVGKQTGLGSLQAKIHEILDAPKPGVLDTQIGNGVHPTVLVEMSQPMSFGDKVLLRPFVQGQAGVETLIRLGADVIVGHFGQGDLLLRDVTSGQLYRGIATPQPGFSVLFGGDIAKVDSSVYLPTSGGYVLTDTRDRLRAGIHWQGENSSLFYGATWLGKEFTGQTDGQVVGSLRLNFKF
jgi:hypothetical protein